MKWLRTVHEPTFLNYVLSTSHQWYAKLSPRSIKTSLHGSYDFSVQLTPNSNLVLKRPPLGSQLDLTRPSGNSKSPLNRALPNLPTIFPLLTRYFETKLRQYPRLPSSLNGDKPLTQCLINIVREECLRLVRLQLSPRSHFQRSFNA